MKNRYPISRTFSRWKPIEKASWVAQVFKRYNEELARNLNSHILSKQYIYEKLKSNGATWEDDIANHFDLTLIDKRRKPKNLKKWSDAYNGFDKWVTLNSIMAIS